MQEEITRVAKDATVERKRPVTFLRFRLESVVATMTDRLQQNELGTLLKVKQGKDVIKRAYCIEIFDEREDGLSFGSSVTGHKVTLRAPLTSCPTLVLVLRPCRSRSLSWARTWLFFLQKLLKTYLVPLAYTHFKARVCVVDPGELPLMCLASSFSRTSF